MKKVTTNDSFSEELYKLWRIMKFTFLFLLIGFNMAFADLTYSQSTQLTLELKNKTLKEVFQEIEKNSEFIFFYSTKSINLSKKVDLSVKKQTINEVLDALLKGSTTKYKIVDRQIILYADGSSTSPVQQRQDDVEGKVVDKNGEVLPGVTVSIKGTTNAVITNLEGEFKMKVSPGEVLLITYVGYVSQEIRYTGEGYLHIKLFEDTQVMEEVVVVGFGAQKKTTMVGSVTAINPKELKGPTSNMTTMMAGRVSGIIGYQRSGEPGRDNADFFIRGITSFGSGKVNPLILIDGIESSTNDLARIQPDDISGFSILKDATAAALFGSRGANGVVLVTTKNGKEGKTKMNFRYESSISSNTRNFKFADNITYMELANEATLTRNPLDQRPYSLEKIDGTMDGKDPFVYPNNDWMDLMVRDYTFNNRVNFNLTGGGTKVVYYLAGTCNIDNGIFKKHELNDFNTNVKSQNYEVRSNVGIKLTPTTEATLRITGAFRDYNGPVGGGSEVFKRILKSNPVKFPAIFPQELMPRAQHPLFGNDYYKGLSLFFNPYAYSLSGYSQTSESNVTMQIELKQDFKFITPGLKGRLMAYTKRYSYFDFYRSYNPFYYKAMVDSENNFTGLYWLNEKDNPTEYLSYNPGAKNVNNYNWIEGSLDYNKIFDQKHNLGLSLIGYASNYITANPIDPETGGYSLELSLPARNLSLSGRTTYSYDSRYMAEFNFGYNGSEKFSEAHRFGFFPSIGVAWNLAEEAFMKSTRNFVDKIKIRASYGIVGNDQIGRDVDRFFYMSLVDMNSGGRGYNFGYNFNESRNGINVRRYANSDITWEKAYKTNIALEAGVMRSLNLEVDLFHEKRTNILMSRSNVPASLGFTAPVQGNLGEASNQGIEISLDYNKSLNRDMWISARGTYTYAHNEITYNEEPDYQGSQKNLSKIGHPINQQFGLIAERYFIDDNEVLNSPPQMFGDRSKIKAGDIKYRDVNGDGQITDLDKVPIGYPTVPEIVYGFGFSFGYKEFDISAYFQGQARSSFWIEPANIAPFAESSDASGMGYSQGLLQSIADSHWSEANRDLYAFYPRLSTTSLSNNNQVSTWWMRDGAFLRLKTVELGYNMKDEWLRKIKLTNFRFYISGMNLFAISKFKLWDTEMGGNGLGYPIQRVFNLGIILGI